MENQPNNKRRYSLAKKIILGGLILVIVFGGVIMVKPKTAEAFITEFAQTMWNMFAIPFELTSQVYDYANDAYEELGAGLFKQALQKIIANIAIDSATYIATGDKGQAPMFQTNFADYLKEESDAFVGDAFNNQVQQMWGVNLCEPPDALTKVRLEIRAREYFRAPKPSCSFTKMWANIRDPRKLQLADLPTYADMFNPSSNDLGAFLQITTQVHEGRVKQEKTDQLQLLMEDGWKSVRSLVTGNIKTPAAITKLLATKPFEWAFDEKSVFTGQLAADFIGPFANTLISKLMKQYKEGLVDDSGRATGGLGGAYGPTFGSGTIQAARERFAALGEAEYRFGGAFDLMNWLSCENTESQYACVVDNPLSAAILEEPHLTVKQALDRNLLHGDWAFGYRTDKSGGIDNVRKSIYSYRSLVILRKYRIIPVGWELAAEYYRQYDKTGEPLTLNRLISDSYYGNHASPYYKLVDPGWVLKAPEVICEKEGPGELTVEETIPIMIDSNQDGEISEDEKRELVIRKPYCADERSCIKESLDGQQCDYYGYCTKEKPIYRVQSQNGECEAIYNSCRSYVTRNNKQVGYLYNTLWGKDACGASDVGCREYCTDWDVANNQWGCAAASSGGRMFLNRQASDNECSQTETGCSEFIRLETAVLIDDTQTKEEAAAALAGPPVLSGVAIAGVIDYDFSLKVSLRKAPDYLNCGGYNTIIGSLTDQGSCLAGGGFWRDDLGDGSCVASGSYECDDYALYCEANDAGCRFYKPVSYQGPAVPGVAGTDDMCPAECVGYKMYMEQASFIDRNSRPVSLIAGTAQSCPAADNGCEEFTNLSEGPEGERKEYYSALRSCILPGSPNTANYYSWESTEEAGNQLRSWELLVTDTSGGYPCTNSQTNADGSVDCIDSVIGSIHRCTFGDPDPDLNPVYNPDCVEFTSQSGASYWVKFSRVIITNDGCVPMRRTVDQNIYSVSPELSQKCAANSAGCREYKGSAANNIKIVLNDDFDNPAIDDGWDGLDVNGLDVNGLDVNGLGVSNESLAANGHSLLGGMSVDKFVSDLIHQGRSYKLTFWAKTNANVNLSGIYFRNIDTSENSFFDLGITGSIGLTSEWNRYEVNLTNLNRAVGENEIFRFELNAGGEFYLDNIILTETQDDLYLIRDSWNTPLACDNPIGAPTADPPMALGEMMGCEHYQDVNNKDWYLKSFSKLCRDEMVGCELMVDTYNSSLPNEEIYNIGGDPNDDVRVPEDSLAYLVYDIQKTCSQVGCISLGLIEPSRQQDEMLFNSKNLIVKPDDYSRLSSPLCGATQLWCDEFIPTDSSLPVYFKNPNVFTCEYKEVMGRYGWYQTGSTSLCPAAEGLGDQGHCMGGRSTDNGQILNNACLINSECIDYINFSSPGLCSSWVGVCPVDRNNCTEYQDPSNPENCDTLAVNGEADHCDFYYYQSDKVDDTSCNGRIDLDQGCRGFHQTDGGADVWYSTARCTGNTNVSCESDEDCIYHQNGNYGSCTYTPIP